MFQINKSNYKDILAKLGVNYVIRPANNVLVGSWLNIYDAQISPKYEPLLLTKFRYYLIQTRESGLYNCDILSIEPNRQKCEIATTAKILEVFGPANIDVKSSVMIKYL